MSNGNGNSSTRDRSRSRERNDGDDRVYVVDRWSHEHASMRELLKIHLDLLEDYVKDVRKMNEMVLTLTEMQGNILGRANKVLEDAKKIAISVRQ